MCATRTKDVSPAPSISNLNQGPAFMGGRVNDLIRSVEERTDHSKTFSEQSVKLQCHNSKRSQPRLYHLISSTRSCLRSLETQAYAAMKLTRLLYRVRIGVALNQIRARSTARAIHRLGRGSPIMKRARPVTDAIDG